MQGSTEYQWAFSVWLYTCCWFVVELAIGIGGGDCCCCCCWWRRFVIWPGVYSSSSSTLCVWHVVKNICPARSAAVWWKFFFRFVKSFLSRGGLRSDNHQIFALISVSPHRGPARSWLFWAARKRNGHLFPIDTQEETTHSLSKQTRRTRVIPSPPPPCIEICTFWMNYWPKVPS